MKITKRFSRKVASQRRKFNLTNKELGEQIGVNGSTISRIETGMQVPTLEIVIRLAKYLDFSLDELYNL